MSLFDSICCCVGVDRNRPKSLQKLKKEDENKQVLLLDNSKKSEIKLVKKENDKLQSSLQNLKAETELKENKKVIEPQSTILQKYRHQSQQDYGDDNISTEFNDINSRKIKTISRDQFFILPCEPLMQFYQHQTLQIQGMLPSNDIQYY